MRILFRQFINLITSASFLIPAAITMITALASWVLICDAYTLMPRDATAYWDMAQPSPLGGVWGEAPYIYRVAIPFLVKTLFHSSFSGFIFITLVSFFISNILVYQISRLYSQSRLVNSLVVIIFATSYTIIGALTNSASVDLPVFAPSLAIVFIFLRYMMPSKPVSLKVWLVFSLLLLISAIIHEMVFTILPIFVICLLLSRQPKKAVLLVVFSVPAVCLHLAIRLMLGPLLPPMNNPVNIIPALGYLLSLGGIRSIFATFGAVWILIPIALYHVWVRRREDTVVFAAPILAFMVLIVVAFFASNHNRYLFFISFPMLIAALSIYFDDHNKRLPPAAVYAFIGLLAVTRLAMSFRPNPLSEIVDVRSYETVVVITSAAILQILAVLSYVFFSRNDKQSSNTEMTSKSVS